MSKHKEIEVLGISVKIKVLGSEDYISLTDIAQSESGRAPKDLIRDWLQNNRTLLFLEAWEETYNKDFNLSAMDTFKLDCMKTRFSPSPKKYIERTNAIGIVSKAGRYNSGTFAHIEIALSFAYWLEPKFRVLFLKEFNRMKKAENLLAENTKKWAFEKLLRSADEIQSVARLGIGLTGGSEEE
jgi:hypothetical protein